MLLCALPLLLLISLTAQNWHLSCRVATYTIRFACLLLFISKLLLIGLIISFINVLRFFKVEVWVNLCALLLFPCLIAYWIKVFGLCLRPLTSFKKNASILLITFYNIDSLHLVYIEYFFLLRAFVLCMTLPKLETFFIKKFEFMIVQTIYD